MGIEWIDVREKPPEFPLRLMWESDLEDVLIFESEGVIAAWNGFVWCATAKIKVPRGNCISLRTDGIPVQSFSISAPLLWNAGEGDFAGVTHWMPLPEPPRVQASAIEKKEGE